MLKNELISKIEDSFKEKIIDQEAITFEVSLLSFNGFKIIVKKVNTKVKNTYDFLKSQDVMNVLYPLKQFVSDDGIYFVYKYMNKYEYPEIKKVYDLINSVDSLHSKTSFNVKLSDVNFKYFYRIYKSLDRIFQTLEMLVRESEIKQEKNDYDWIILSKYHTFLDVKNIMYSLQKKIHKYIDSKGSCIYALNHGNLSLNHFIGKKFISFDNSYLGIFVSDYAKLYVSLDDIEGEWFKEIDKCLKKPKNDFYLIYFKFLVLYIYMINLKFSSYDTFYVVNTYNQIESKISLFLTLTSSY